MQQEQEETMWLQLTGSRMFGQLVFCVTTTCQSLTSLIITTCNIELLFSSVDTSQKETKTEHLQQSC